MLATGSRPQCVSLPAGNAALVTERLFGENSSFSNTENSAFADLIAFNSQSSPVGFIID